MRNSNYIYGSFSRLSDFPLDDRYLHETKEDLVKYITSKPTTAHEGQLVYVINPGELYLIKNVTECILEPLSLDSDYGDLIDELKEYINRSKNNVIEDGKFSSAHGTSTITNNDNQFVVGKFNKPDVNALFMVGSGYDDISRTNGLSVYDDGRVSVGKNPTEDMDVVTKKYLEDSIKDLDINIDIDDLTNLVEKDEFNTAIETINTELEKKASKEYVSDYVGAYVEDALKDINLDIDDEAIKGIYEQHQADIAAHDARITEVTNKTNNLEVSLNNNIEKTTDIDEYITKTLVPGINSNIDALIQTDNTLDNNIRILSETKADLSYVDQELEKLNNATSLKADASDLEKTNTNIDDLTDIVNTKIDDSALTPIREDITELSETKADKTTVDEIAELVNKVDGDLDKIADTIVESYATKSDLNTAINKLIDSAPGTLDTLGEIAEALNDNKSVVGALSDSLSTLSNNDGQLDSRLKKIEADYLITNDITGKLDKSDYDEEKKTFASKTDLTNISYNDLKDAPAIPSIEGLATSDEVKTLSDSIGYESTDKTLVEHIDETYAKTSNVPTKVSELTNDKSFVDITTLDTKLAKDYYIKSEVDKKIAEVASGGSIDLSNYYNKQETEAKIDELSVKKTSELDNDSGFITANDIPEIPSLNGYATEDFVTSQGYLTEVPEHTHSKDDITDLEIPTKTSELTNDSGFITANDIPEIPSLNGYATEDFVTSQGYLTEVPSDYAKTSDIPTKLEDLSGYDNVALKSDLDNYSEVGHSHSQYLTSSTLSGYSTTSDMNLAISTAISNIDKLTKEIVSSIDLENNLVDDRAAVANVIYLLLDINATGSDIYKEYTVIDGKLTLIGDTSTDLSNYYSKDNIDILLSGKANSSHTHSKDDITDLEIPTKTSDLTNDSGFIDNSVLDNYTTKEWIEDKNYLTDLPDHTHTTSDITDLSIPTKLSELENDGNISEILVVPLKKGSVSDPTYIRLEDIDENPITLALSSDIRNKILDVFYDGKNDKNKTLIKIQVYSGYTVKYFNVIKQTVYSLYFQNCDENGISLYEIKYHSDGINDPLYNTISVQRALDYELNGKGILDSISSYDIEDSFYNYKYWINADITSYDDAIKEFNLSEQSDDIKSLLTSGSTLNFYGAVQKRLVIGSASSTRKELLIPVSDIHPTDSDDPKYERAVYSKWRYVIHSTYENYIKYKYYTFTVYYNETNTVDSRDFRDNVKVEISHEKEYTYTGITSKISDATSNLLPTETFNAKITELNNTDTSLSNRIKSVEDTYVTKNTLSNYATKEDIKDHITSSDVYFTINGQLINNKGNISIDTNTGASVTTDAELDKTSANPIQNKPVATKFESVDKELEDLSKAIDDLDSREANRLTNNILSNTETYAITVSSTETEALADILAKKGNGMYTCRINIGYSGSPNTEKTFRGLCMVDSVTSVENKPVCSGWIFMIDTDNHCYSQIIISGVTTSWRQLDKQHDISEIDPETVIFKDAVETTYAIGNVTLTNGKGTLIPAGGSLMDFFNKFIQESSGTNTNPSIGTISFTQAGKYYEVGYKFTPSVSFTFEDGKYTYGPEPTGVTVTAISMKDSKNVTKTLANSDFTVSGTTYTTTFPEVTVSSEGSQYRIADTDVSYSAGSDPKSNLGNDYPSGKITAGTISNKTSSYVYGYRPVYFGTFDNKNTITNIKTYFNGKTIRTEANAENFRSGTAYGLSLPVGIVRVAFAYPKAWGECKEVVDTGAGNFNIVGSFSKSEIEVEGTYSSCTYYLYVSDFANGITSSNTYNIKLK